MAMKTSRRTRKGKIDFSLKRKLRVGETEESSKDIETLEFYKIPALWPRGIDRNERRKRIIEGATKAKSEYGKKYDALSEWFSKYDPIYLLTCCAFYYLSYKEGEDPELTGDLKIPPYSVEILQAMALSRAREFKLNSLAGNEKEFEHDLNEIGSLLIITLFSSLREDMTDEEMSIYHLCGDIALQTIAVRNWAYPYQMRRIVMDLTRKVEDKYKKIYGISLSSFIEAIYKVADEREGLLNEHIKKIREFMKIEDYKEMIMTYDGLFPENTPVSDEQIEQIWEQVNHNIDNLKGLLAFQSELKAEKIYSFNFDHFLSICSDNTNREGIRTLLDKLSYRFGDLENYPREYFIRDNPVHNRPFIKTDDSTYFSAIFYIIPHLMLDIVEWLLEENTELKTEYINKIRPSYLENETERLFRIRFPNAEIYRGSLWTYPEEGKEYENDLIVIIDTFALVIEAKSGGIPSPARRGAPLRLAETLKGLVEAPSEQAQRFARYLKDNKKEHIFSTKRTEINKIDSSKINYYVPISVTLSSLGVVGSNLKKIVDAGITKKKMSELAVSISLTDLECVFEILSYEAEIIHYFFRRREFDDHVDYEGDELDLLNFYLGNGFNIGEAEYDKKNSFLLINGSKILDPYFISLDQDKKAAKPKHQMTKWWEDILTRLSAKKPQNWIETSFILLNTAKADQEEFEKAINELIRRIIKKLVDKKHNWVRFTVGPGKRRFMIVGLPYLTKDMEERNALIGTIIESEGSDKNRGIVIIGRNLSRMDYPYSVLAGRLDTNLSSF